MNLRSAGSRTALRGWGPWVVVGVRRRRGTWGTALLLLVDVYNCTRTAHAHAHAHVEK